MDTKEMQKRVYQNKINHNWNVEDLNYEFCLLYGEVGEAYEAYHKHHDDLGYELADVAIYLLGIAEILNIDLGKQIEEKMAINEKREYVKINGVEIDKEKLAKNTIDKGE